ncbi:hypothetical protein [Aeromonas dhakensis]|uniref:hypothetical protein n=1 Tax=Aeromonas dhakensis TaxID=196024 RepID=UPI003B9ED7F5
MKVLQTLGSHAGNQPGIFQYWRDPEKVNIDMTVGRVEGGGHFTISNRHWAELLEDLCNDGAVQTLTGWNEIVRDSLGNVSISEAACIVAVLEHEGSIDHYGGIAGRGIAVDINLKRQF